MRSVPDKSINKYVALLMAGFVGIWLADIYYPPLDENPLMGSALVLWAVGGLLALLTSGRSVLDIGLVRRIPAFVGVVLVLISTFVILNGALDHYPLVQAETRVVQTGLNRRGPHFIVVVSPSWRQGRNQEAFEVHGDFYRSLQPDDLVRIEVHRGAFWLPWGPVVTNRIR
jgi:hypothetical protein